MRLGSICGSRVPPPGATHSLGTQRRAFTVKSLRDLAFEPGRDLEEIFFVVARCDDLQSHRRSGCGETYRQGGRGLACEVEWVGIVDPRYEVAMRESGRNV